ncbi:MAG: type II secretion system protein [Limnobacter sp.]|nr:type II secretion system protein [Limnobacter sp.]
MRKLYRTYSEGFTLVEILITIAIVGIISSFALSSVTNAVRNANFVDLKDAASRFAIAQQGHRQIFNRFADQVSSTENSATDRRMVFTDADKYEINVRSTSYNEFTADLSVRDTNQSPTDNCHTVRVNSRLGILKFESFSKNGSANTTAECLGNG